MDLFKVDLSQAQIKQLIQGGKVGENEIKELGNGLFEITELDCDSYTVNSAGEVQGKITNHCTAGPNDGAEETTASNSANTSSNGSAHKVEFKLYTNEENCGWCKRMKYAIADTMSSMGDTIEQVDLETMRSYIRGDLGYNGSYGFPTVVKLVDGKAVEMYDRDELMKALKNIYGINMGALSSTVQNNESNKEKYGDDAILTSNGNYILKYSQQQDFLTKFLQSEIIEETGSLEANNLSSAETPAPAATTAGATSAVQTAAASGTVPTDEEIQALITKKEVNEAMIKKLQDQIKKMVEEAKKEIEEAIEEQEEIAEEQKQEIERIIEEQLQAYEDANGEMTLEEFESNVANAIFSSNSEATRALVRTVSTIMKANTKLKVVDSLLVNVKSLAEENISLDAQIDAGKKAQEAAKRQQEEAARAAAKSSSSSKKSCDPISFNLDGAQYDFIVDDGAFDSANDFLGAQNYFEAMKALDTDGDNKVTRDELEAGNIKLVKTENGQQSVVDVANLFDSDDFVDLSSYTDLTGADEAKETIAAGGTNSVTLGTFGLVIGENNEQVEGVSTLDAEEYLKETYGFEDDMTTPELQQPETEKPEVNSNEYLAFVEEYTQMTNDLRAELEEAAAKVGFTTSQIETLGTLSKAQGDADAKVIAEKIKTASEAEIEQKKADEAKKAEEAKAAEEAKKVNTNRGELKTGDAAFHTIKSNQELADMLAKDEGVTFIYYGSEGCHFCKIAYPAITEAANNLNNQANFVYWQPTVDKNREIFNYLKQCPEYTGGGYMPMPAIIKCVNGKPVEWLNRNEILAAKRVGMFNEFIQKEINEAAGTQTETETKTKKELTKISGSVSDALSSSTGVTFLYWDTTAARTSGESLREYMKIAAGEFDGQAAFLIDSDDTQIVAFLKENFGKRYSNLPEQGLIKCVNGVPVEYIEGRTLSGAKKAGVLSEFIKKEIDEATA